MFKKLRKLLVGKDLESRLEKLEEFEREWNGEFEPAGDLDASDLYEPCPADCAGCKQDRETLDRLKEQKPDWTKFGNVGGEMPPGLKQALKPSADLKLPLQTSDQIPNESGHYPGGKAQTVMVETSVIKERIAKLSAALVSEKIPLDAATVAALRVIHDFTVIRLTKEQKFTKDGAMSPEDLLKLTPANKEPC